MNSDATHKATSASGGGFAIGSAEETSSGAGQCDDGFELAAGDCIDIDECAAAVDNCDVDATCTNNSGAFTCTCNSGYGGGVTCAEIATREANRSPDTNPLETPSCDANTGSEHNDATSTTLTFSADGTTALHIVATSTLHINVVQACMEELTGTTGNAACVGVEQFRMYFSTATCTFANNSCSCDLSFSSDATIAGTHAISGTTMTNTDPGGSWTHDYCVEGNRLLFDSPSSTAIYGR